MQEDRQEKEEAYQASTGFAKSFCSLANESLELFQYFTETLIERMNSQGNNCVNTLEIMDRVASQLNYFLVRLVGKGREIKVNNPEQYNFDPVLLIKVNVTADFETICKIYGNYGPEGDFPKSIARDERSFQADPDVFDKAIGRCQHLIVFSRSRHPQSRHRNKARVGAVCQHRRCCTGGTRPCWG